MITELNEKYGAAGRVAFRRGLGGLPVAVLVAPAGSCEVSLYGGQVIAYRPVGHQPVLYLSPLADSSEGAAIRGGIPVCWPWFGKREGLPAHGFARRAFWHVLSTTYTAEQTEIELGLTHRQATHPAWPHPYTLRLTIAVGACLSLELQTRNIGDAPFTYSDCLHAYLALANASRATLHGLNDTDYVEPPADDLRQHASPLSFEVDSSLDRIYRQPGEINLALRDPVLQRTTRILAEDVSAAVVWHPAPDAGIADLPPEASRRFVCVEPANPQHPAFTPLTLAPGETHFTTLRLQVKHFQDEDVALPGGTP